jgi:hypothetical protein
MTCARCHVVPATPRWTTFGRNPIYCDDCRAASLRESRYAISRRYLKAHPEKARTWRRERHQRLMADPQKVAALRDRKRAYQRSRPIEAKRAAHRRFNFGIEPEQFQALWDAQRGACALCDRPFPPTVEEQYARREPQVDHDHLTGAVRGLLCRVCNTRLGALEKMTPDWLDRVAHYARSEEAGRREALERLGKAVSA